VVDWGDVPTWVGAIVTSGSVAVAALAYRRSVIDREGAQASGLAAWVGRRNKDGSERDVLLVSNGSDAPAYEVSVQVLGMGEAFWFDELPAHAAIQQEFPSDHYSQSLYNRLMQAAQRVLPAEDVIRLLRQIETGPRPELEFRDAAGRMWRRNSEGRLSRLRQRTTTRPLSERRRHASPPSP
jgi:hypothetical protein